MKNILFYYLGAGITSIILFYLVASVFPSDAQFIDLVVVVISLQCALIIALLIHLVAMMRKK